MSRASRVARGGGSKGSNAARSAKAKGGKRMMPPVLVERGPTSLTVERARAPLWALVRPLRSPRPRAPGL